MNTLVTGGAGFIGSALTKSLLLRGHRVTVVDDLSTGSLGNVADIQENPNFRFVEGDILSMPDLEALVGDSDLIFHLAAAVGVELVVHDPVQTLLTNVHGASRLLELAAARNVRTIIASTSEVYGKSTKSSFSETDDLVIGAPTRSRWSYACSKLIDEFFLMAYVRNSGFAGTVVRFFNIVGPGQTGKYGMVLPRFVRAALKNEPLQVYGNGAQSRCFCHVNDAVRALELLADNPAAVGEIYNVGSQQEISMLELAKTVIGELGSASAIELVPYDRAYAKGFEDMMRRSPAIDKIRALTGWEPKLPLRQIIADVADFERAQL